MSTGSGSKPTPPPPPPPLDIAAILEEDDEQSFKKNPGRWYFDKAGMENTPSRRAGIDADKELSYRQSAANFIQEMGQKLKVNQLCNNTAIVYMNRFYMFHSFAHFHRNAISIAAIFLAAKVEEQPRKLDHVVRVAHYIQYRNEPMIDSKSEAYHQLAGELVNNENILLQTLGFDLAVDHPHTHIIKCCQLVRASKDLGQVSYLLATNILHLTTMCVQHRPTLVASLAIQVACKWSGWQIPRSKEGKDWWKYVDEQCTYPELEQLTQEYLDIYAKAPQRLKLKAESFSSMKPGSHSSIPQLPPIGTNLSSSISGPPLPPTSQTNSIGNAISNPNQRDRSSSPSPKRLRVAKPGESYGASAGGMFSPLKPHQISSLPTGQHGMKIQICGMKPQSHLSHHKGVPLPPQKQVHHEAPLPSFPSSVKTPYLPQPLAQATLTKPPPQIMSTSNEQDNQAHPPHGHNTPQQRKPLPPYFSSGGRSAGQYPNTNSQAPQPLPGHVNVL